MEEAKINRCLHWVAINDLNYPRGEIPKKRYRVARRIIARHSVKLLSTGTPADRVFFLARNESIRNAGFNLALIFMILKISFRIVQLVILWWDEESAGD